MGKPPTGRFGNDGESGRQKTELEFITPHQLLRTLWAKQAHIAKARRSPVLKIDVAASGAA